MGSNSDRHDTISLTATIYYPFHPMQGRELSVTNRSRNPELPVTVIDETGTGLRIPAWMVAPEAAHYHLAAQATLDVQTLRTLAALLIPLFDDSLDGGEDLSSHFTGAARSEPGYPPGNRRRPSARRYA